MMSIDPIVVLLVFFVLVCVFGLVVAALVVGYVVGYNRGGAQATNDMNEALARFDQGRLQRNAEAINNYAQGPHSVFGTEQSVEVQGPEALFRHPGDVRGKGE